MLEMSDKMRTAYTLDNFFHRAQLHLLTVNYKYLQLFVTQVSVAGDQQLITGRALRLGLIVTIATSEQPVKQ